MRKRRKKKGEMGSREEGKGAKVKEVKEKKFVLSKEIQKEIEIEK